MPARDQGGDTVVQKPGAAGFLTLIHVLDRPERYG
jgi:hypothetical protein